MLKISAFCTEGEMTQYHINCYSKLLAVAGAVNPGVNSLEATTLIRTPARFDHELPVIRIWLVKPLLEGGKAKL